MNVVLPFVGGGSIFRTFHDLGVKLDKIKVEQAKAKLVKYYPDAVNKVK